MNARMYILEQILCYKSMAKTSRKEKAIDEDTLKEVPMAETVPVLYDGLDEQTHQAEETLHQLAEYAPSHFSLFTDFDINLIKSGKHYQLYNKLGSHIAEFNGVKGTYFAVWAPNAKYVSVIGNFNGWDRGTHKMNVRWDESGIW